MCGIAGWIYPHTQNPHLVAAQWLKTLEHRGPDDYGLLGYSSSGTLLTRTVEALPPDTRVLFLHRRLSIIDLTEAGWQPMQTRDGRYSLVFNGEIYNYLELKKDLERLGHVFYTHSDTEVLLIGWAAWGQALLERLVGMFAFAVLDLQAQKVTLVRDFFGIKPLYYAQTTSGVAFASEIKALLELEGVSPSVNPQRLYPFLRFGQTDHGAETMFRDVQQVPPAHLLEIDLGSGKASEAQPYWNPRPKEVLDIGFEEAAFRTRELFLESVNLHLRSDVPVGSALSGGVDSSAIVMTMRELNPNLELHAFGYIADDDALSEEKWMDLVGMTAGAKLHKIRPQPEELLHDLDDLVYTQDEPFGSTSIYAQSRVFREAKAQGITVMLDGQGADELLGGYAIYSAARLASLLRQGRIGELLELLRSSRTLPNEPIKRLILQASSFVLPDAVQTLGRKWVGEDLGPKWLNVAWLAARGVRPSHSYGLKSSSQLRETLLENVQVSSLPRLLRFEDRNSMRYSLESRVPFLTPQLSSFLLSLPEQYLISAQGVRKSVFRQAMRGIVPDAILDRKDKVGFVTPEQKWLSHLRPWVERVLSSETAKNIPVLNFEQIQLEWKEVITGQRPFDGRVWRWINLIAWSERFGVVYD